MRRKVGLAADGLGAAALVAAVVLDVFSVKDHDTAASLLAGAKPADKQAFDDAMAGFHWKRTAALTAYVAGGAVLATGLVLSLMPDAAPGATRVGVAPFGDGAVVTVSGGWR